MRTGTLSLSFPVLPPGVTVAGLSGVHGSLRTGHSTVVTVNVTSVSARHLRLLLKARTPSGQLLYPSKVLDVPI